MNQGRTVFSQLIAFLPDREFRRCVARYDGDTRLRTFSCWDQYLTMAFAQLTYRESLRDIEACLRAVSAKLYHMGFHGKVARTTLADANESRDWRIFADFAQILIRIARPLYAADPIGVDLDQSLYALDSTTIDLCLSLFPWAKFRSTKQPSRCTRYWTCTAISPRLSALPDGKVHDVNILDEIASGGRSVLRHGSRLRGFRAPLRLHAQLRPSSSCAPNPMSCSQRRYSHPVDKTTGVRSDHTVILTAIDSVKAYPDPLRRVSYRRRENRGGGSSS